MKTTPSFEYAQKLVPAQVRVDWLNTDKKDCLISMSEYCTLAEVLIDILLNENAK